jgi:hypothetical protein
MILLGGFALILLVFWLRVQFHRARYNRAIKAMQLSAIARQASSAFRRALGTGVLIIAVRLYLDVRAH